MIEATKHISPETERCVLGSMILSINALVIAADTLYGEMFYERRHQLIFNAIVDSYTETGKIDLIILSTALKDPIRNALVTVGGSAYLSEILNDVPTTSNIRSHCKTVKKLYTLRRIELFGYRAAETAGSGSDPDEILRTISGQLLDLSEDQVEKTEPSVLAILAEIKNKWRDIQAGKRFHIDVSDELFGDVILGWYPGHVVTIGGATSSGKSLILSQIIVDAAEEGASQIIFSLEDSRHEKMYKILGNLSNVPQRNQIKGVFDDDERQRLKDAQGIVSAWPLLIYDDVRTIEGMRLKIKKAQMKGKVDIVAIDFIQNISEPGSLYERMSNAAITLQGMAKSLGVTMIILSQIDNESTRNPNANFIGLKGAGELAAASDVAIWISKDKKGSKERDIRLSIRKNRAFGVVGGRDLQFSPRWTRIERRDPFDDGLTQ